MPSIEKTEALALRIAPYSRTSHVVTWLSPTHGRLATMVKGACRPRSAFLGRYDLFHTCELLFYAREHNGLHIARECTPLRPRCHLRRDWRASACASYMCDMLLRTSWRGNPQAGAYDLAEAALDALGTEDDRLSLLFWFELRLAQELGLAPQLVRCTACAGPLTSTGTGVFACDRGGLLCPRCTRDHRGGPLVRLPPDILALLRKWQQCPAPAGIHALRASSSQLLACRRILGIFLEYYLDASPASRATAIATVQYDTERACR